MKAIVKDIFYWALALIFAGVMLVGIIAYIDVAPWAEGLIKVGLFTVGFSGCAWASNRTRMGERIAGKDIF